MARKGAKYLLVLSRSGATSVAAAATVNELTEMGVKVMALKCDISVQESLSRALDNCKQCMPPIRGCVNATIALKVSAGSFFFMDSPYVELFFVTLIGLHLRKYDTRTMGGRNLRQSPDVMESSYPPSESRFLHSSIVNFRHHWKCRAIQLRSRLYVPRLPSAIPYKPRAQGDGYQSWLDEDYRCCC